MGSHKMETSHETTGKRRRRGKRRAKSKDPNSSKLPSPNLSGTGLVIKKKCLRKVKKVTKQCVDSFIKGFCENQIKFVENQEKTSQLKENLFDQTVDLSDDDNSVNCSNSSPIILSSYGGVNSKSEAVIDLSKDFANENEIIDLTEATSMSHIDSNEDCLLEPTVIDISEDDTKDKPNLKPDNEEISVIGTYIKTSKLNNKCDISSSLVQLSNRWSNYNNIISCSAKLKKKYLKKQSVLDKIDNKNMINCRRESQKKKLCSSKVAKIGENIYVNSPVSLPTFGLRPIIIDGSNVAFVHSNFNFNCKRLEICINYFKEKGHKVTAFVPQYRLHRNDDPQLLRKLERQGDVILTPSKKIDGRNIVPYDDRFIVQTAALKGGIIVTRDNYNDLLKENPAWAETIKYRTLAFTWVDDVLMFPKDPLGEYGPSLEEFLRFH